VGLTVPSITAAVTAAATASAAATTTAAAAAGVATELAMAEATQALQAAVVQVNAQVCRLSLHAQFALLQHRALLIIMSCARLFTVDS
jgi:hypothetical protein